MITRHGIFLATFQISLVQLKHSILILPLKNKEVPASSSVPDNTDVYNQEIFYH